MKEFPKPVYFSLSKFGEIADFSEAKFSAKHTSEKLKSSLSYMIGFSQIRNHTQSSESDIDIPKTFK
jgi:hypothetical protein